MIEHEQFQKKLYGRRKGPKLSAYKENLRQTLLPRLALNIVQDADPRSYFEDSAAKVWLEIGFGAGEHMLALARAYPDVGLIGAEPYESGVAKLLTHMADDPPAERPHP
jgi:tRNA (guanine-N7-)-methyltransferase